MRVDIFHHFSERFIRAMANADLLAQFKRATDFIATQAVEISDLKTKLAAAEAANAGAADAEDEVDASALSSVLDAAGVPPLASSGPSALAIDTSAIPTSIALNATESANVVATGGVAPYVFSATSLPDGFSIDSATGNVSGMASVLGVFETVFSVADAASTVSAPHTITVG